MYFDKALIAGEGILSTDQSSALQIEIEGTVLSSSSPTWTCPGLAKAAEVPQTWRRGAARGPRHGRVQVTSFLHSITAATDSPLQLPRRDKVRRRRNAPHEPLGASRRLRSNVRRRLAPRTDMTSTNLLDRGHCAGITRDRRSIKRHALGSRAAESTSCKRDSKVTARESYNIAGDGWHLRRQDSCGDPVAGRLAQPRPARRAQSGGAQSRGERTRDVRQTGSGCLGLSSESAPSSQPSSRNARCRRSASFCSFFDLQHCVVPVYDNVRIVAASFGLRAT